MDPTPSPSAPPPPPPPAASAEQLKRLPATCPVCGDEREEDAQFCQNCGHNFVDGDSQSAPKRGLPGPMWLILIVFWAILGIVGMYWLYTGLYGL